MKAVINGVIGAAAVYGAFAVGGASFDVSRWGVQAREMCGLFMLCAFGASVIWEALRV